MGSDAWLLQDGWLKERLVSTPLLTLDGVRFALSAQRCKAEEVKYKLEKNKQLTVAATYPGLAKRLFGVKTKVVLSGGGLEALPSLMPQVDAVLDIVETRRSVDDNDLVIIADNLWRLTLDAVWPKSNPSLIQSNPEEQQYGTTNTTI